ncbi:MAG TPA: hypothetical protein PLT93_05490 [Phycisphaerae bacterium]|nr:hypothetical protein [Phycisphaerae bacterium]HPZ97571.1 hypothetical protein [Phycisphaerae bacterium]
MASIRFCMSSLACLFSLTAMGLAQSAEPPPAGPVPLSDRAADDGLARLIDAVWALPVSSAGGSQSVAGLLGFLPDAEYALRQAVAAERQVGRPRELRRGTVAVDVSISAERLNALIREALQRTVGSAAPNQVALASSVGPVISVTGLAVDDGRLTDPRPGWRHCSHEDIKTALESAELDLRQRVFIWLRQVRLSNRQTVGQLARQRPALDQALRGQVERVAGGEAVFEPNGTCVLTCTVSAELLMSMVSRALQEAGVTASEGLAPEAPFQKLTVRAFSVAPPQTAASIRGARAARGPRPPWADQVISKTAAAAGPVDEPAEVRGRLATIAARAEAQRQLWMELEQLVLPDGRTLADAIAARQDRDQIMQRIGEAVFATNSPSVDDQGVATVTLAIHLETVWQILAR